MDNPYSRDRGISDPEYDGDDPHKSEDEDPMGDPSESRFPKHSEQRTKTNVGVGLAVLLQLTGFYFVQTGEPMVAILGLVLLLISIPVFIWGCMHYAEGKKHSKWVGLVGVAGIIGLIVLIALPDQERPDLDPRSQLRKRAGLILVVVGIGLALLGAQLDYLAEDPQLERLLEPWLSVCKLLGFCVGIVGVVMFTRGDRSRQQSETA